MPLRELILSLDPPPPEKILSAAKNLRYRDYLTVVLIVKREKVFPDNWIYIHTPGVKLGRVQNYKNWSPEMVPDPSRTSLGLEYFLWEKDEEWRWSDDQWIALGIRECVQIGLIEAHEVEEATLVRMKKAYPVYDQLYHESVSVIRSYLGQFKNLQTVGRNGLHRYNNQDHSMLTGIYAARNIQGATYDVWDVNTDQDYHEEDAREQSTTAGAGDPMQPRRLPKKETGFVGEKDLPEISAIFAKIDAVALGTALGLVGSILFFILTGLAIVANDAVMTDSLSLLAAYLIGYGVSWGGALLGALEVGLLSWALGYAGAALSNWGISFSLSFVRHNAELDENQDLMDKV